MRSDINRMKVRRGREVRIRATSQIQILPLILELREWAVKEIKIIC